MIPYQTPHGRKSLNVLNVIWASQQNLKDKNLKGSMKRKQPIDYITVEELSRFLGAKI